MNCYVVDTNEIRRDIVRTLTEKGTVIKVAGLGAILFVGVSGTSFANAGIDVKADQVYKKLLTIAKWVIVFKGGIETIKSVADGDHGAVKKNFLGYGVTYAILWGLPWMMKEIDKLFSEMDS
ncbi:hypothetical protein [Paenibacillus cremeus]|uniref:Uncharacterized protein n=1 Tax=Paenibacillus cremeus TaxID=2163881 RepID=A0A559K4Y3_9BACL|nr:hypothetical protein [Paenibacillus cremeus]TVY07194.1 hypothetical protein FPZ49_25120 [Paenibacillus cremeus]